MKNQHTPGPWEVIGSNVYSRAGWQDMPIATPCINSGIEQSKANANLIASAPELLAALKSIKEWLSEPIDYQNLPQQIAWANGVAKAAIAKAEGAK